MIRPAAAAWPHGAGVTAEVTRPVERQWPRDAWGVRSEAGGRGRFHPIGTFG
jgi:hypothetical protein